MRRETPTSKHRGVSWIERERKWDARVCVNGKTTYLGSFKREEDAAAAHAAWVAEHIGYDGTTKVCSTCRQRKALSEYATDSPGWGRVNARCRTCRTKQSREWQRRNPEKHQAHVLVHEACERGELTRPEGCERCGEAKALDAHHEDYEKPLEVRWLCRSCHRTIHGRLSGAEG